MNNCKISLCKADRSLLGTITGLKTDTCTLVRNATDFWEITFDVNRYIDENGRLIQSNYYDSIDEMMKLYLDGDDIQAFFVIDKEPTVKGDGYQEVKSVTAHSIECELSHMYLNNFKINCGTHDSQEYLVTDSDGNYINVNPYTGLPYEYISLVNYQNTQLSLLHLALEGTGWTVKEGLDTNVYIDKNNEEVMGICQTKMSFDTSDNVYSFLMKTVSPAASIIFEFDRKNKQVGFVPIAYYGNDTGVFITMRNLMNNFEVTSSSDNVIRTKIIPTGANNLGIEQVNFGKDYILNLDYFMNTLNEYGEYKYVSKDLHDKYNVWKNYRDVEKVRYPENKENEKDNNAHEYTRRELYSHLTKLYNQAESDINELKNRLPNDGCFIDYTKFSLKDLKQSLTAYQNALNTLLTCYKNDIIHENILPENTLININDDFSLTITPEPEKAISYQRLPDTAYWHDYYAYKEKIIPQVIETFKMYCETDDNGKLITNTDDGSYIELEYGNQKYYTDTSIVKNIDSYLYEWSLYGLDELESKKKAWGECANLLFKECFIYSDTAENPVYRTPDDSETGWNGLSKEQKAEFTTQNAFFNQLNQFLDYMSFDDERENSITGTKGKGILRQCEDAIEERKKEISELQIKKNNYGIIISNIANSVTLESFEVNGTPLFTEKDVAIIHSMLRTQNYSNEYILTTNLDNTVSTVDRQEDLYQNALEELYRISQPQYSFKTELDNLYALDEFKQYQKPFDIGNFIRVGLEIHEDLYDNQYIKLRLISITHNPLEPSAELSVEFSTMTKSLNAISDLAFLLDSEFSSSGTASSSSSSGGTYGNNDSNVQISNNTLNALLKTEMFGTAVNDVILDSIKANKGNFNTLLSNSGMFNSLETGELKVSGNCLFDKIQSNNFAVPDDTTDNSGSGSSFDLAEGTFVSYAPGGNYIKNDGKNLVIQMKNFSVNEDGDAKFSGHVNGGKINIKDTFIVDEKGEMTVAKTGSIAGWKFNENCFYKTSDIIGAKNGKYFGNDGLSLGDNFIVYDDGFSFNSQNENVINDKIVLCGSTPYSKINRIYVYGYDSFPENHEFFLYVEDYVYLELNKSDLDGSTEVNIWEISTYKFKKSDIKNVSLSDDISNNILSDIKNYISIKNIGYVDYEDLKPDGSDIEDVLNFEHRTWTDYKRLETSLCSVSVKESESIYIIGVNFVSTDNNNDNCARVSIVSHSSNDTMMIDSYSKTVRVDNTLMTSKGFSSKYLYDNVSVSGKPLYINSNGTIGLSGSSKRFKNSISTELTEITDPHALYDIDIVQYKYNDDYFSSPHDEGLGKYFIGFIAENVADKFKDGATYDQYGNPDGWDIRYMFPAALKLIQEQHEEIEKLKASLISIKESFSKQ